MRRAIVVLLALSAPVLAASFRPFAGMRGDTVPAWTTPQGSPSTPDPTFDMLAGATTPNDLSDSLTVNATSMTLVLACDARGVSGTNWTCRDASGAVVLSEAGTGPSPTVSTLTPHHAVDATEALISYKSTGKRHDAPSQSFGNLGTDDIVVEYSGQMGSGVGASFVNKDITGTDGWNFGQNGASGIIFQLRTASITTNVQSQPSGLQTFIHGIVFVDRSEASVNGAVAYLNGAGGTGVDMSARSGSVSNNSTLSVGATSGGVSLISTVGSIRIWRCSGCFAGGATNPAQWAPIARQRAAIAFGVAPIIARGDAAPTTLTRATTAHVDVVDGNTRQLYLVSNNAPRVARRTSQGSPIAGYLSEPAVSNIALQSQTLETTWTPITVGDNVLTNTYAGADLTTTGDDVDGADVLGEHGLRQSITLTAATHTLSAWARAGEQSFVALRNNTIANGAAWFDVATCTSSSCTIGEDCASAVGTVQAGVIQARAQRWPIDTTGDGVADVNLCRMSISYTGTVAAHDHDLLCAPSNGVTSYTDSGAAADCGFWGVRVEAFATMTSYLATTTASVARNADDLRFDGASHYTGSPSTMDTVVLCPNFVIDAQRTFFFVGSTSTDYAYLASNVAQRPIGEGSLGAIQWTITRLSGDITDGITHSVRQTMETNNISAYYDNVIFGSDTLATLPTVAGATVRPGSNAVGGQPACLINRARLWSSLVAP